MDELILVVEDSRTQAMLLENILQGHNYEVAIVDNGEKAIEWLSENNPSLVISDIVMPGMDGYELCRQIKTQKPTKNIPVILLTSLNGTEEVIEGLVAGADSFITKPYDQDFLISHIAKILADHSGIDSEKELFGVEILFEGKKRIIQADQQQTIKLLLNIYEGAIQKNTKLLQTQEQLKSVNENLESMVEERTLALSEETILNKQIAEKLKESEQSLQYVLQGSQLGFWDWNLETNEVKRNERWAEMLGYKLEDIEFTVKHWTDLVHPDDQAQAMKSINDHIEGRTPMHRIEYRMLTKDGHYIWILDQAQAVKWDTEGHVIRMSGTHLDITKRKIAEENLAKNKVLLTETERMGKIGGWEFDVETMVQSWTDEIFRILEIDLTKGEPKVPEGIDFIDPNFRPMAVQAIQRAIEFGEPYDQEWQITTTKGNKRWIHTFAKVYQEKGKTKTVSGSFQDITDRKLAELKVIENEQFLKTITSEVQAVIFVYDAQGIFTLSEGKGLQKLGLKPGQVVGMSIFDVYKDYPDLVLKMKQALEGQAIKTEGLEVDHLKFDTTFQPIFDKNGVVTSVVGLAIDVTEAKQAAAEINLKNEELLKVNAEKDKFFSIIAHDLRSPLSSFLGLTRLMAEELPSMQLTDLQDMAVMMEKSASNLFSLLENLLEWAKVQRGLIPFNPAVVQLHSIVHESLGILIESIKNKGIELNYDIPVDTMVFADTNMLQTVIRNLVSNAAKFTPKGGKIYLKVKASDNNNIEISIQDLGIGMTPAMLNNLFQLNSQTNRKGTEGESSSGLGLLLCKEFIEKLGGKIGVESEEGKGSVFHFTLPCHAEKEEKIDTTNIDLIYEQENQVLPEVPGLKILIAEDDEESEMLISLAVEQFSKEVLKVRNGVEAVETCRIHPNIDLLLMDIRMPEMDGYEATRQIRQFNTNLVIVAQTAFAVDEYKEKAIEAGCTDHISKPINKAELADLVKKYFTKSEKWEPETATQ